MSERRVQVPEGCAAIELTQGQFAIVDADLMDDLIRHKWSALRDHKSGKFRAYRSVIKSKKPKRYRHIWMHRQILGIEGCDGTFVDHIDGNPLNNRRKNLRIATLTQNNQNVGIRPNNTSGFKGVHFHKLAKKYVASIRNQGKSIHLGFFDTPESAHEAYCQAAIRFHGEFANFGQQSMIKE
jgi:hypothetical protein